MDKPAPRIRPVDVSRITSLSLRQIQNMAASGRIPGAAKLGGVWIFDPHQIDVWIKAQEQACQRNFRRIATGAMAQSGVVSSSPKESIDEAFEQLIRRRPHGASRHGKRSSKGSSLEM